MRFLTALVIVLFICNSMRGQADSIKQAKIDSLTLKLKKDSTHLFRFNKLRPYANVDNRNSFVTKLPINIQGGQLGIIVNEYHVFGFGFYTALQTSQNAQLTKDNARAVSQYLTLHYYTFFYQYVLLDKRFIELDLPFEAGWGRYGLKYTDITNNEVYKNVTGPMVPLGAGLQVVIKPFRWIGFSTTGGYRYVGQISPAVNLNGLYYSFGLWLDVRQIYRDVKYYGFMRKKYKKAVEEIRMH